MQSIRQALEDLTDDQLETIETLVTDGGQVPPSQHAYCENCDARRELVPVAGGDALACCRCDAIVGGDAR